MTAANGDNIVIVCIVVVIWARVHAIDTDSLCCLPFHVKLAEGVMVVKKDAKKPEHDHVAVKNIVVMNILKSLNSRGFVRETFNWQWRYYYLTDAGLAFLRKTLGLADTVKPATHKVRKIKTAAGLDGPRGRGRGRGGFGGSRGGFGGSRGGAFSKVESKETPQ